MGRHPANSGAGQEIEGMKATSPMSTVHREVTTILRDDTQGRQTEAALSTPQTLPPFLNRDEQLLPLSSWWPSAALCSFPREDLVCFWRACVLNP